MWRVVSRTPTVKDCIVLHTQSPRLGWCLNSAHCALKRQSNLQRVVVQHAAVSDTCQEGHSVDDCIALLRQKQASSGDVAAVGKVFLIGTGPGDPDLLTLRAAKLLQTAEVVLYDRLVSEDILQLVNPAAKMVYVGKQRGYHTRTQEEIHELLVAFAGAGATVVRLKGGDPFIFGRGGEEMLYLQQHGIQVQCVPGITAAAGVAAELGIPLTHRGYATSVRYLTGHSKEGGQAMLDATVASCADPHTTLVIYMGLQTLPLLCEQLTAAGLPQTLPCAAIERGTTPQQKVMYSTLQDFPRAAELAGLKSPTLIVIGEVVSLSPGWQAWQAQGSCLGQVFSNDSLVSLANTTPCSV